MSVHVLPRVERSTEPARGPASQQAPARGLAVTVRQLAKSFGAHPVIRGLDLNVPAGQFVAIVGKSGCGKSTLLRLLLGLEQPSGGRFWFRDPADAPPDDRLDHVDRGAVRIMFQEPRLLPWASVLSNVEVGLGDRHGSTEGRERALAALRSVGLEDRRDDWPSVLSGGQKQRVALARALVSRPRVLAFDEPLGALDALTRISMQKLLEQLWLDRPFTAILVTHDVAEAVTLADRVLVIEDGAIAIDVAVDLPRPRQHGSAELALLERRILAHLLGSSRAGDDA